MEKYISIVEKAVLGDLPTDQTSMPNQPVIKPGGGRGNNDQLPLGLGDGFETVTHDGQSGIKDTQTGMLILMSDRSRGLVTLIHTENGKEIAEYGIPIQRLGPATQKAIQKAISLGSIKENYESSEQVRSIVRRMMEDNTRRVTIGPDGQAVGGFQPTPSDPNAPVDPEKQARRQQQQQYDIQYRQWIDSMPFKNASWGGGGWVNLDPNRVQQVAQGADPNTLFLGRKERGIFGADPSQYQTMAKAWLDWHAKMPQKPDLYEYKNTNKSNSSQKPRQGPLRPQTGAGKHKDKKKDQKQGKDKHKKPFMEQTVQSSNQINIQQDPKYKNFALHMARADRMKSEMEGGKISGRPNLSNVAVTTSPEYAQEVNRLFAVAKQIAGPNLQAYTAEYNKEKQSNPDDLADIQKQLEGITEGLGDPRDWDEGNRELVNNFAIYINGKKWKVLPGPEGAYADSPQEFRAYAKLQDMCRRKSQETGKQWEVVKTGERPSQDKRGVAEGSNSLPSYLRGESRFVKSAYKTLIKYGFIPDDEDERTSQMGSFKHAKGHMADITWEGNIKLLIKQPNGKYMRLYLDDATEMPKVAAQLQLSPVSTEQGVAEGSLEEGKLGNIIIAFAIAGGSLIGGAAGYESHQNQQRWKAAYEQIKDQDPATAEQIRALIIKYKTAPLKFGPDVLTSKQIDKIISDFENQKLKEQGVAEGSLTEMDKSAPQPGRDGRVSHSTYGSRDKGGSKGPEKEVKPITAKKAKQDVS